MHYQDQNQPGMVVYGDEAQYGVYPSSGVAYGNGGHHGGYHSKRRDDKKKKDNKAKSYTGYSSGIG